MIKILIQIYAFLLLMVTVIDAQDIVIHGIARDYAGGTITFYTCSDQITNTEKELSDIKIADDGSFQCIFHAGETMPVFSHLGIYRLFFIAEPGKEYDIALPPWQQKTEADLLNPYFKEYDVPAVIHNSAADELNTLIRMFDDAYEPYYDKFATNLKSKDNPAILDTAIVSIMRPFKGINNHYFKEYASYKIGMLRHMAYQFKSRAISDNFFMKRRILYRNIAYMELFNQVYDKYFMYFMRTPEGKQIISDINTSKSLYRLKETLHLDKDLQNDSLLEFVILKNLYDEFYADRFSRSAILCILDSINLNSHIAEHREIAENIRKIITHLLPGYEPPQFSLLNKDSASINLSDLKGKYVYLCFCSCFSYACLREFEMLQRLYDKHGKYLEVVVISVDRNLKQIRDFLAKNNYNWIFLYYGTQPDILKAYDIRGYPTYFLLDKKGKLLLSPAPSPFENIELRLFELMRERGDI